MDCKFALILAAVLSSSVAERKVCSGTNNGLSILEDNSVHYERLRYTYEGCTHVDGNLEIVGLNDPSMDLSFLESIQEVSGYVLIAVNVVPVVPLTNLRVIRGQERFWNNNALLVVLNYDTAQPGVGLRELPLYSLKEIAMGNVNVSGNRDLCHVDTIQWEDMIDTSSQELICQHTTPITCDGCEEECNGHCWTKERCQTLSKTICHAKCDNRCHGSRRRDCCHPECIAGCTGPENSDCLACRNLDRDGQCVQQCSDEDLRDANQLVSYQGVCLHACPANLLEDDGECVTTCSSGKVAVEGSCQVCDGRCPKSCPGIGNPAFQGQDYMYIDERTIGLFKNCTIIDGSIVMQPGTFDGDPFLGLVGVTHEELEVFNDVEEITGHLTVFHSPNGMADLSAFRNLKYIRGRSSLDGFALTVSSTALTSISLSSLQEVSNGGIYVRGNSRMCYASKKLLSALVADPEEQLIYVGDNKPKSDCRNDDMLGCHSECTDTGCWGPDDTDCFACKNFDLTGRCVETCDVQGGFYLKSTSECGVCHEECELCYGPGAGNCTACKNVRDQTVCRNQCPSTKYADENKVCQECHSFCAEGCSGPSHMQREGGCDACIKPRFHDDGTIECLDPETPAFICDEDQGDCIEECRLAVEDRDEEIIELHKRVRSLREEVVHLQEVLKFHYDESHGRDIDLNDLILD